MAKQPPGSEKERKQIEALVDLFLSNRDKVSLLLEQVLLPIRSGELGKLIHSIRFRIKDPDSLRDKLYRKLEKAKADGQPFDITPENFFSKINDLAGIRLLHLHTSQISEIDSLLKGIIEEQRFGLLEGPIARTWDDEYRDFFNGKGITTRASPNMYTSVHYVLTSNSRSIYTCELQIRTLMEEVWGEVDHKINYPHPIDSVACKEQIRALARSTSSATRLVDSIFATVEDIEKQKSAKPKKSVK